MHFSVALFLDVAAYRTLSGGALCGVRTFLDSVEPSRVDPANPGTRTITHLGGYNAGMVVVRTKLTPPRLHRRLLPRPQVVARLREALDYRLAILQAGTGYGSSTALAMLAADHPATWWLSLTADDADPGRLLTYLAAACQLDTGALADWHDSLRRGAWRVALETVLNALHDRVSAPTLLIVDDYHTVSAAPDITALMEHFISHAPPHVHLILSTHHPLHSPALTHWRVRGEVLDWTRTAVVFEPGEIAALFHHIYGLELTPAEVALLADKTEGWPLGLHMVWQGVRHTGLPMAQLLNTGLGDAPLNALFDDLARNVLGQLPPELAAFLRATAILRELTPAACAAVSATPHLLERLIEQDLFVITLGDRHARYHHLFHDFLRAQWRPDPAGAQHLHQRAAAFFSAQGDHEEAIYHWLNARLFAEAATEIERAADRAVQAGRLDVLTDWLAALPAALLLERPALQHAQGELHRLRSRFDEALACYRRAEQMSRTQGNLLLLGRALRGQARIYVDTVRPRQAEPLLEEALHLTDEAAPPETRARLLDLLAENKLNLGKPHEAESLWAQARRWRGLEAGDDPISIRLKLRTGRLREAAHVLAGWAAAEAVRRHPPRAHRETVLILSLIHALEGRPEPARQLAEQGIALGAHLQAPFIAAVAHIRLAHALQLLGEPHAAIHHYRTSMALGDQLAVRRTHAEALWGLTRVHGLLGDLPAAEAAAREALDICDTAGDQWMAGLTHVALGMAYILNQRPGAAALQQAAHIFADCGDPFGRAVALLALHNPAGVALAAQHGYDALLTQVTLLGATDPRRHIPWLVQLREARQHAAYITQVLTALGVPHVRYHPGYQLRVAMLGGFRVWRGSAEVDAREWKRDKARQLFQLLLGMRRPLTREAITERLWPRLSPEAAERDFKVALNALNKTLDPTRAAEAPSAYIAREGTTYLIRPEADLWLDVADFEHAAQTGLRAPAPEAAIPALQAALRLYAGDYLPDAVYDDWTADERERLLTLYLQAADRLAGLLLEQGQPEEALQVGQGILARDPCWERAYRVMMLAYDQLGNRPQALRLYQRCVATLQAELGVDPSPATVAVWRGLVG